MGRVGLLLAVLSALSGCYTQTWYAEGRTFAEMEGIYRACRGQGAALGDQQEAILEDQLARLRADLDRDDIDLEAELDTAIRRESVSVSTNYFMNCMLGQRVYPIELRRCPEGVPVPAATTIMPGRGEITCAARAPTGWPWRAVVQPS